MTAIFKSTFLEDLIDACVMECYFREHMLQRDLLFHDDVAQILEESHTKARSHEGGKGKGIISDSENLRASASSHENSSEVSSENLRAFVASCETSPIRNRLLRLTADSPDLLAVIKEEGRVGLANSALFQCHRTEMGRNYPSVYGRMEWDAPAPTCGRRDSKCRSEEEFSEVLRREWKSGHGLVEKAV